eukprot:CAMPEP_0114281954 /NCGR_PEP_ID=MMETSP0059-20121206/3292_1 /TAXON_ID=36894 /ORGANISM="Pyramimonas parkeae, Strain CCMP726" /LENGTH=304 /DNA_ID=CAMNT_0001402547 /DNA_START=45 /DNA_END=959 /DNA_ORIENTATION=-
MKHAMCIPNQRPVSWPGGGMMFARSVVSKANEGFQALPKVVCGDGPVALSESSSSRAAPRSPRDPNSLSMLAVGTSFDGRQQLLKHMEPSQPLLLVREPENPFDANAVAVRTLSGESAGYVSKHMTHHFIQDITVGRVVSVGASQAAGTLGLRLECSPHRPSLYADVFPQQLINMNVSQLVPPHQWNQLRRRQYAFANFRCQICDQVGPKWPVECTERWAFNCRTSTVRLEGLLALCPSCHEVKHLQRLSLMDKDERALQHLRFVNQWSQKDLDEYMQFVFRTFDKISGHNWITDFSWLSENAE